MIGEVRWFNTKKGFGFIKSDNTDYFVFYKNILMGGYRKLEVGQKVTFELKPYQGYKQATHVKLYG